jgi:carboxypeptidase Q
MKKIISAVAALLCFFVIVFSQEKVDLGMMEKIKDEERTHSQITMIAHNITDVCGPRLTNSPGYKRAIDWVTQTFKQWGLQNAGPEPWGEFGKGWSTEASYLAMRVPYYQPLIAYPVAWTKGTEKNIPAEVVLVDKLDSATIENDQQSQRKNRYDQTGRKKSAKCLYGLLEPLS